MLSPMKFEAGWLVKARQRKAIVMVSLLDWRPVQAMEYSNHMILYLCVQSYNTPCYIAKMFRILVNQSGAT